jgi:hypothetical protein
MRMNWKILKNPKFIVGGLVLFVVVLWMVNRSGGGGSTVVQAGNSAPADNTLALAQIQAAMAGNQTAAAFAAIQDQDQTQIALATIAAAAHAGEISATANIAALGIAEQGHEAELAAALSSVGIAAQSHAADLQYQTNVATITAAVQTAQMAYDSANYTVATNAALQVHLSDNQLQAYEFGTAASIIPSLKKGDRDNAFYAFMEGYSPNSPDLTQAINYHGSSGGGLFGSFASALSPVLGAIL